MEYAALYNPYADNGNGKKNAEKLPSLFPTDSFFFEDVTKIDDYRAFFSEMSPETQVVLCGGDGTLNRFINDVKTLRIEKNFFYFPCGSGNDFARDVGGGKTLIPLGEYVRDLPVVAVNGKEYRFVNGIGFGIDGYCCETGDKLREKYPKKKIDYTRIAVKGLLFRYKPTRAIVTVDGEKKYYKKVWLAPVMFGRYYGGGMLPAPRQTRENARGKISVMVFHGCGKAKALCMFPSIFKGEHVKYKKNVSVLCGGKITVCFDKPRALQIDGETITNVTEYTVKSAYLAAEEYRKQRLG